MEMTTERETKRQKHDDQTTVVSKPRPNDILLLDVGGTPISVFRRTLTQVEGSLLASQFSGRWDEGLAKTKEGRFFIDQPPHLFEKLINFLRMKANETDETGPNTVPAFMTLEDYRGFSRMVEYFGLSEAIFRTGAYLFYPDHAKTIAVVPSDDTIESPLFSRNNDDEDKLETFILGPLKDNAGYETHSRAITGFEITLQKHELCQVGWLAINRIVYSSGAFNSDSGVGGGVGFQPDSTALDVVTGDIVTTVLTLGENDENKAISPEQFRTQLPHVTVKEGSVIRCEMDHGFSWFVDGMLVGSSSQVSASKAGNASTVELCEETIKILGQPVHHVVPCITVNGGFSVTDIRYAF
ncbi:SH3KBP1-binding protein 1 [Seminavis robusta]|uniref:SH3KBP1-binding protein 1 n=1 Tax=Seminavis robusta TaxID=568900 RepID=A0A9N8H3U5_9STRA|nr:SH3KBP1-binding protein 1 [Seminavis robusta]|eukprot:Sro69_g038590.1 SH3KBP1-binding protein 1 (354) ;mRNA; r:67960-69021